LPIAGTQKPRRLTHS